MLYYLHSVESKTSYFVKYTYGNKGSHYKRHCQDCTACLCHIDSDLVLIMHEEFVSMPIAITLQAFMLC